jgi:hypothetical protein
MSTKVVWAMFWVIFFTGSSGHPGPSPTDVDDRRQFASSDKRCCLLTSKHAHRRCRQRCVEAATPSLSSFIEEHKSGGPDLIKSLAACRRHSDGYSTCYVYEVIYVVENNDYCYC